MVGSRSNLAFAPIVGISRSWEDLKKVGSTRIDVNKVDYPVSYKDQFVITSYLNSQKYN